MFELFEVYVGKSRNLLCFENGSTLVGQFVSWSDEFQKISNGLNLSMVMPMQCQINGCIPLLQFIANQTQSDTQMWCYTGIYLLGISIWFTYVYGYIWLHLYITYGYTCIISAPVCSVLSFQPLHSLRCTLMLRSYIEHSMAVCLIKLTAFGEILQNQIQTRCLQKVAVKTFPLHDGPHGFHLLARASSSR